MKRLYLIVGLLSIVGCRESVVGPIDPPLDLLPDVVGEFSGTYEGELGLLGVPDTVIRDTFQLAFTIDRIDVEFVYDGEMYRGGETPDYLYGCGSGMLTVSMERRVQIDCVQSTQFDDTVVLRVAGQFDTTFDVLRGVVYDVNGVDGAQYPVELRRSVEPT
ncbi:MAG: hypothetical protein Rubg2KO_29920 [Rubricoccaceae bacterium]